MNWFITGLLGAIVLYCIYKLMSLASYWKDRGMADSKSLPIIKTLKDMFFSSKTLLEIMNDVYNKHKGLKYVAYIDFLTPTLLIRDPKLITQILIKDFAYFQDRGFPIDEDMEPLNCGLPNLNGNRWRILRYKLTPTFTSGKLKLMFSQIKKCSNDALDAIESFKKDEEIESKNLIQKFILNVIGSVAFGLNINAFHDKSEESVMFLEHSKKFFAPSTAQILKLIIRSACFKLAVFLRLKLLPNDTETFFTNLVREAVKFRENTGTRRNDFLQLMMDLRDQETANQTEGENNEHFKDKQTFSLKTSLNKDDFEEEDHELLEHLQNVGCEKSDNTKIFTENMIAAQSFVFISGGSETTASALSFALYEIAANPSVQTFLQTEIDNILVSQDFDYKAVKEMTYMDQFINEVLRLHPIGVILLRECVEDYRLPGTNNVVEKGTRIIVPVSAIHKDPQYFPDPETFNPDRFQDMKTIPKGVFFPFGAGPRICIAMRLAVLEMKIFLARLLMDYSVILGEKTQVPLKLENFAFVPHVVGGIWVKFEKRQQ